MLRPLTRALPQRALQPRNVPRGRARALPLAFLALLLGSCDHGGESLLPVLGVVWDRITPQGIAEADYPDWRADSIAFQVLVSGADRIAVAREDGSGVAVQPETGNVGARTPRWVRAGLLVESSDRSGSEDLWYREIPAGITRRLDAFSGGAWTPAPRPGSPGLVYVEGAAPDSGRLVLIPDTTQTPLDRIYLTPASLGAGEPDWNPAGDRVAFSVAGSNGTRQIWSLSLIDTLPVALTVAAPSTIDRSPRWSPDGARILLASNRGGLWGVWTLSPLGEASGLRVVAQDVPGGVILHPVWSPDGTRILLSSNRSGERALWRLSNLSL